MASHPDSPRPLEINVGNGVMVSSKGFRMTTLVEGSTRPQARFADTAAVAPFDEFETRRLLRKLDIQIIPFLALIYLLVLPFHDAISTHCV